MHIEARLRADRDSWPEEFTKVMVCLFYVYLAWRLRTLTTGICTILRTLAIIRLVLRKLDPSASLARPEKISTSILSSKLLNHYGPT